MKDETLRRELARLTPGDADVEAELQHVQHVARRRRAARRAGAGLVALAVVGAGFLGVPQLMDRIAKQRISTGTPAGVPDPEVATKTPMAGAEGPIVLSTTLDADAAYVMSGRYSNDSPAPARLVRVDRQSGRITATQSLPLSGSITGGGDTLWVTQSGGGPGATNDLLGLDPVTLAIRHRISLPDPPGVVVGLPGALWVGTLREGSAPGIGVAGLYRIDLATLSVTQRIEPAGPVTSLVADPGGRYLYTALNTPLTVEKRDGVTGRVVASKGDFLAVAGGGLAVAPGGLWVSYAGGMLGSSERYGTANLQAEATLGLLGDKTEWSNHHGVVVAGGLLWAIDADGLWCGDASTGQLRAKVSDQPGQYAGDDRALYEVTPGGITQMHPDAACAAPPHSATVVPAVNGPVVKGQPTLTPPAVPQPRTLAVGGDCKALGDNGWTVTCGRVVTPDGPVIWLVERKPALPEGGDQPSRAYLFVPQSDTVWRLALQFADETGRDYFGAAATTVDLPSGLKHVLFGFRMQGTGGVLRTDVVNGGSVVASPPGGDPSLIGGYDNGVARIGLGKIEFWTPEKGPGFEPHCCYSLERHDVVQCDGQHWRLTSSTTSPRGDRIGPATGTWPDPFLMGYGTGQ